MRLGIDIRILLTLDNDTCSAAQIAKTIGCSQKTVYSRMPVLHREGWVELFCGYGKNRKYYRISKERKKVLSELSQVINTIASIEVQESETER